MTSHQDIDHAAVLAEVLPLVPAVVRSVMRRVSTKLSFDELSSAGREALVRALAGRDGVSLEQFTSYCRKCIKGAVLEELRRYDPLSRVSGE